MLHEVCALPGPATCAACKMHASSSLHAIYNVLPPQPHMQYTAWGASLGHVLYAAHGASLRHALHVVPTLDQPHILGPAPGASLWVRLAQPCICLCSSLATGPRSSRQRRSDTGIVCKHAPQIGPALCAACTRQAPAPACSSQGQFPCTLHEAGSAEAR